MILFIFLESNGTYEVKFIKKIDSDITKKNKLLYRSILRNNRFKNLILNKIMLSAGIDEEGKVL